MEANDNGVAARGKRPPENESVLDRTLRIFEVFSDRRRALTLSELSRHTGLPMTTTLRMVNGLMKWGALERLDDGRYVIGVRLWEVASLSPRGHGVRHVALPYLEDLYEVTRHHVHLAIRDGKEAVLIERLSSRVAPTVAYRVGGRVPLRYTAVGLVLLAAAPGEFQEEVLADPPEPLPWILPVTVDDLRRTLIDVRRSGLATIVHKDPIRSLSVAAPIKDASRSVVAAISIVVPDGATSASTFAPAIHATALSISRSLGYRWDSTGSRGSVADAAD